MGGSCGSDRCRRFTPAPRQSPESCLEPPSTPTLEFQTMIEVPDGFPRFSDAVNRLAMGMWGGLQRPVPAATIKHTRQNSSVGFGLWREQAGQCLRAANVKGELLVRPMQW